MSSSGQKEEEPQQKFDAINQTDMQSAYVNMGNNNFYGPSYIFNCGYRSLREIIALQEQSIKHQQQPGQSSNVQPPQSQPAPQQQTHLPTASHSLPKTAETPASQQTRAVTRKGKGKQKYEPSVEDDEAVSDEKKDA